MSKEHPKVYFANSMLETCYFVRCLLPLREGGWDGDRTSLESRVIPDEMKAKGVLDADIIVFHRPNDERSMKIAQKLREQGKKIVADNDDTYKGLGGLALSPMFQKIDEGIDSFVKHADLVTCSTEFLAKEYRELNPNVVVLPNCVDPEDWPDEDEILRNEGDKVRIGISGSVGLGADVNHIKDVLEALSKRPDVQLVVFALPKKDGATEMVQRLYKEEYAYWESLGVEWHPFVSIRDYREKLNELRLDIMLIPRKDDYFNRCKSNLKFLECSMLSIAVIAQGFPDGNSPYQNVEDAQHMELIVGKTRWAKVIDDLIKDKNGRREMARKARAYVLANYQIRDKIKLWETAYRTLLSQ